MEIQNPMATSIVLPYFNSSIHLSSLSCSYSYSQVSFSGICICIVILVIIINEIKIFVMELHSLVLVWHFEHLQLGTRLNQMRHVLRREEHVLVLWLGQRLLHQHPGHQLPIRAVREDVVLVQQEERVLDAAPDRQQKGDRRERALAARQRLGALYRPALPRIYLQLQSCTRVVDLQVAVVALLRQQLTEPLRHPLLHHALPQLVLLPVLGHGLLLLFWTLRSEKDEKRRRKIMLNIHFNHSRLPSRSIFKREGCIRQCFNFYTISMTYF